MNADESDEYSRGADRGQPCFTKGTLVTFTIQRFRLVLLVFQLFKYDLLIDGPARVLSWDLLVSHLGNALTVYGSEGRAQDKES